MSMKIKKLIRGLVIAGLTSANGLAFATWQGKLDLEPSVSPIILREAHDGQWLYGIAHPNLFKLLHNENTIFHVGAFQAWNAESRNASFGLLAGVDLIGASRDIGLDIPLRLGQVADWANVGTSFGVVKYVQEMISLDFFGGYRPVHTDDVLGQWVYGAAASLKIKFGAGELQNGNIKPAAPIGLGN